MSSTSDKLAQFQAITGLQDTDLCTEILSAHNWDLQQAISTITSTSHSDHSDTVTPATVEQSDMQSGLIATNGAGPPGLAWKLITLPISIVSGSLGLVAGAVGLGLWLVGGVLSYSFSMIGLTNSDRSSYAPLVSVSNAVTEAMDFVSEFEREYGDRHPRSDQSSDDDYKDKTEIKNHRHHCCLYRSGRKPPKEVVQTFNDYDGFCRRWWRR